MMISRRDMRSFERVLGILVGIALVTAAAFADEPLPTNDEPPLLRKTSPTDSTGGKGQPTAQEEKVLKSLEPDAQRAGAEIERLERAIEAMRQASRRIEADDTGSETTGLQKGVVEDLERLIVLLKRQQNRNSSSSQNRNQEQNQNQNQSERQSTRQQQLDPQNSGRRPQKNPREGESSERSPEEKSREAQERLNPARIPAEEEARRQQMLKDVWGHLPPHIREAMRNSLGEKYLPRYEELIKRYYETLAEKNRDRSSKPRPGF